VSENHRLPDYLDHIQRAATDACSFVEGLTKDGTDGYWQGIFVITERHRASARESKVNRF